MTETFGVLTVVHLFQGEITVSKYPNRILVYSVEGGYPMFFDIDGRGTEIFPAGNLSSE